MLKLENYTLLFTITIGYRDENDSNQSFINLKSRLNIETVIQSI